MRFVKIVVVLVQGMLLASVMAACGGNGGYNPNKPTDVDNRPASPPGGIVPATATVGIFEGDCSSDLASCANEVSPTGDPSLKVGSEDKTFVLSSSQQMYTKKVCVTHQAWAGRKIGLALNLFSLGSKNPSFDEGDPGMRSPACVGLAFRLNADSSLGSVSLNESGQDLLSATEWRTTLGLRLSANTAPPEPNVDPTMVVRDDEYTMARGTRLEVSSPGVRENDTVPSSAFVYFGEGKSSVPGLTNMDGRGGFIVDTRSQPNFTGTYTWKYSIQLGSRVSNSATITVKVLQ